MKQLTSFWESTLGKLFSAAMLFSAAWLMFLSATDSGSLKEWGTVLFFLSLCINRLYAAVFKRR